MHKSAAWPLTWMYCLLVVYASLYPFTGWRDQGIEPWAFLAAPMPRYWTGFDVLINLAGYMPLGALLVLLSLRARQRRWAWGAALGVACLLSLTMESLQSYLPQRIASREDWLLNTAGAGLGAWAALLLARRGGLARWDAVQQQWFAPQARAVFVLLLSWPAALLFPSAIPFGVGHVWARLREAGLALWSQWALAADPPAASAPDWGSLGQPAVFVCVVLGLLAPCLMGFLVVHQLRRRVLLVLCVLALGVVASGLSAALSWGPAHTWAWLDAVTLAGLLAAGALALALVRLPWRWAAVLVVGLLVVHVGLLNQAPESPYFSQTLQAWEQGRFVRFNGLAEWLGWGWPYAAMAVALHRLWRAPKIGA
jgi:VanZ family protein